MTLVFCNACDHYDEAKLSLPHEESLKTHVCIFCEGIGLCHVVQEKAALFNLLSSLLTVAYDIKDKIGSRER